MKKAVFLVFAIFIAILPSGVQAAYMLKNGRLIDARDVAYLPAESHYNLGIDALKEKNWPEAVNQFRIITVSFPDTALANESFYYLGVAYYHTGDMDVANSMLSTYIKNNATPSHFEDVFRYKLAIADAFKSGAKRHMFGLEKFPRWLSAKEEASDDSRNASIISLS